MNYVGRFFSNFKDFYNEINAATLTGAIDVIVIQQEDGSFLCSPFHVRFGKMGVLRSREKLVDISINGVPIDLRMKLGESGEAFFVQEASRKHEIPSDLATSPIPTAEQIMKEGLQKLKAEADAENKSRQNNEVLAKSRRREVMTQTEEDENFRDKILLSRSAPSKIAMFCCSSSGNQLEIPKRLSARSTSPDSSESSLKGESLGKKIVRQKHRRRRKSGTKKGRSKQNSSVGTSSRSEVADMANGAIFHMEDVTAEEVPVTASVSLGRTLSMPNFAEAVLQTPAGDVVSSSGWRRASYAAECHPFSDGDVTPAILSPVGSRPPTPKSDTEYETSTRHDATCQTEVNQNLTWEWGKLPGPASRSTPQHAITTTTNQEVVIEMSEMMARSNQDDDEQRSVLSSMFRFMRKTKKMRHQPEKEGIYLDQLIMDDLDPEVAALYFPPHRNRQAISEKDEDAESGKGRSLPQSPHSVEGAIGFMDKTAPQNFSDVGMSLCGVEAMDQDGVIAPERFRETSITYEEFCRNPKLLFDPKLIVRLAGKNYPWQAAAPMVMSMLVFEKPLAENAVEALISEHILAKKQAAQKIRKSSWWSWGRASTNEVGVGQGDDEDSTKVEVENALESIVKSASQESGLHEALAHSSVPHDLGAAITEANARANHALVGNPENIPKREDLSDMDSQSEDEGERSERFQKSLRLTSLQIAELNLHEGVNDVSFSVTTQYQGTARAEAHIFLWRYDDRIIISDVDGTITKSDVLGHILPVVGRDWAQLGVAQLFTAIAHNGYRILYLSARAIGQAGMTRDYLRNVRQGEWQLPDGPILLSPSSLVTAFHKEVIERKPEEFKISCLRDVQSLFPPSRNPFYAGYGNKVNDVWAYRAVGIPLSRIFTINHRGEVRHEMTNTFQTSYVHLRDIVDQLFPPLWTTNNNVKIMPFQAAEEFSSFTYWRQPLPDIQDEIAKEDEKSQQTKK